MSVRAKVESGETWDDPSEDLFFELLSDIERGDETLMVVERLDQQSGDHYIQTIRDADGMDRRTSKRRSRKPPGRDG